jgi:purine-nucleoside phosphorylase
MSFHIAAKQGEIAETVLISGDPLRIKHMASVFLEDAFCFNEIRGMLGYTGFYKGKRISMLGTGIGIPSTALFLQELAKNYKVKSVIRVGTMGAMQPNLSIGDIVLALSASSDSNVNRIYFDGLDFAPTPNFELLQKAYLLAKQKNFRTFVGPIFSTDSFYGDDKNRWNKWIDHGNLGVEMETSILYTLAARFNMKALSVLSVSDNIVIGTSALPDVRETAFTNMFSVALEIAD